MPLVISIQTFKEGKNNNNNWDLEQKENLDTIKGNWMLLTAVVF